MVDAMFDVALYLDEMFDKMFDAMFDLASVLSSPLDAMFDSDCKHHDDADND
jgi:hypothetical protein